MKFGTVLTAMVTPFRNDDTIDFDKTTQLIEHLLANGTDGLVVAGTTGESPTLSSDEKIALWRHVVKVVNGRVPVIAGSGSNSTQHTIQLSKQAEKTGVDALMIVAPYYNKPNQKGLYAHFKAVASAVELPVMIYNVPGRSVVRIDPETVIALSKIDNIVSVKEATADLDGMAEIISNTSDDFSLYSGDDHLTLPAYAVGADGIISVSAHVIGTEMQNMLKEFVDGNTDEAAALHRKLLPVFHAMFQAPSPAPVKAALKHIGIDTGSMRLPLVALTSEEEEMLRQTLQSVKTPDVQK
ncbi:4-hydroxy-tetrahydrodipicolinate synthase [Halobacillus litoralis]|uniref:4-hydroxy-tetrahydrodipicolinate synthase n=1 Tax=Halobacillus litoralis TaxID=45668 RepID=UPI001CD5FB66|nr:4-hydroxy-tetrahydrodipicolinate synthase [Halobacillus litoralis]MCA0969084.1 4-hydroxy-tetrahydrodipicolinate synthase [Halobacillus litoralis]